MKHAGLALQEAALLFLRTSSTSSSIAYSIPIGSRSRFRRRSLPVFVWSAAWSVPSLPFTQRMHSERAWSDTAEVFRHRRAAPINLWERWVLGILLFLGLWSVVYFGVWWFRLEHVNERLLFVLLSLATWYGIFRMIVGWYNAFHLEQPDVQAARDGLAVAIFTTSSPGEPYEMFVRTLAAAREITYPHTTYLLDDTRDPRFGELARQMGAEHMELIGLPGAKAGKINEALRRTSEEFILVLDPDHIPFPLFLHRVLGYFRDPAVGFVQVSQAYHNANESFVARAAAEQTFSFYGPIMQGMHGTGTSVGIGANCTFRRTALDSIGGHGIGLAEDLVTSIRLHAAGWRSVYVPEVVARGLVPAGRVSSLRIHPSCTAGRCPGNLHLPIRAAMAMRSGARARLSLARNSSKSRGMERLFERAPPLHPGHRCSVHSDSQREEARPFLASCASSDHHGHGVGCDGDLDGVEGTLSSAGI